MILVDMNNFMLTEAKTIPSYLIPQIKISGLNTLRILNSKYKNDYGEMVLCFDNKGQTWRHQIFPNYKHARRAHRKTEKFDWAMFYQILDEFKTDLRENFPYKVLSIEGIEADDTIAVLTEKFHENEKILIVSSDKDFLQLQKFKNVNQLCMFKKETIIKEENPNGVLLSKILKGDRSDGIPNILSGDDCFVNKIRQNVLTWVKFNKFWSAYMNGDINTYCESVNVMDNYKRNCILIDYANIPESVRTEILTNYQNTIPQKDKSKIFDYLRVKGMTTLMDHILEF